MIKFLIVKFDVEEYSGSVVECKTWDRRVASLRLPEGSVLSKTFHPLLRTMEFTCNKISFFQNKAVTFN